MNEVLISFLSRMMGHCQIFVKDAIIRYELKRDSIIIVFHLQYFDRFQESLNNISSSGIFISEWLMLIQRILDNKKNKKEKFHEMRDNKLLAFGSTVWDIILFIKISINS